MAEADPEKGRARIHDRLGGLNRVGAGVRVTRAVREKDAVGPKRERLPGGGGGGNHMHLATRGREQAQDVALDPEVVGHDLEPRRNDESGLLEVVGGGGGDFFREVEAVHVAGGARAPHQGRKVEGGVRDDAALGSVSPQVPGQRAGVDAADPHDALLVEPVFERPLGAITRIERGDLADHEARHLSLRGLHIVRAHSVVADVRIGHRHDLAGVGGIGQNLLIPRERGVEDHLAGGLAGTAEAPAGERGAVFKNESARRPNARPGAILQNFVAHRTRPVFAMGQTQNAALP